MKLLVIIYICKYEWCKSRLIISYWQNIKSEIKSSLHLVVLSLYTDSGHHLGHNIQTQATRNVKDYLATNYYDHASIDLWLNLRFDTTERFWAIWWVNSSRDDSISICQRKLIFGLESALDLLYIILSNCDYIPDSIQLPKWECLEDNQTSV